MFGLWSEPVTHFSPQLPVPNYPAPCAGFGGGRIDAIRFLVVMS